MVAIHEADSKHSTRRHRQEKTARKLEEDLADAPRILTPPLTYESPQKQPPPRIEGRRERTKGGSRRDCGLFVHSLFR